MKAIYVLNEAYFQEHSRYAKNLEGLGFDAPANSPFKYSIEITGKSSYRIHARLIKRIGKASAGDEIIVGVDQKKELDFQKAIATGRLQSYIGRTSNAVECNGVPAESICDENPAEKRNATKKTLMKGREPSAVKIK